MNSKQAALTVMNKIGKTVLNYENLPLIVEAMWLCSDDQKITGITNPMQQQLFESISAAVLNDEANAFKIITSSEGEQQTWWLEQSEAWLADKWPLTYSQYVNKQSLPNIDGRFLIQKLLKTNPKKVMAILAYNKNYKKNSTSYTNWLILLADAMTTTLNNDQDTTNLEQLWLTGKPNEEAYTASLIWTIGEIRRMSFHDTEKAKQLLEEAEAEFGWDRIEAATETLYKQLAGQNIDGLLKQIVKAEPLKQVTYLQAISSINKSDAVRKTAHNLLPFLSTDLSDQNDYLFACKLASVAATLLDSTLLKTIMTKSNLSSWSCVDSIWYYLRRQVNRQRHDVKDFITATIDSISGNIADNTIIPDYLLWQKELNLSPDNLLLIRSLQNADAPTWTIE